MAASSSASGQRGQSAAAALLVDLLADQDVGDERAFQGLARHRRDGVVVHPLHDVRALVGAPVRREDGGSRNMLCVIGQRSAGGVSPIVAGGAVALCCGAVLLALGSNGALWTGGK